MSLCLIKPARAMKCGPQGSECGGEGKGFCLSAGDHTRCEGLGGKCLPAETCRLLTLTGQREGH